MASSYGYLDTYCDTLKYLPNEFYRLLTLIRSLDNQVSVSSERISVIEENIIRVCKSSEPPNLILLQELRTLQTKIYNLQTEKIHVVKECELMFEDYLIRLDEEMLKFSKEFPNGVVPDLPEEPPSIRERIFTPKTSVKKRKTVPTGKDLDDEATEDDEEDVKVLISPVTIVDPQLYCLCRQPQYGEMVGCDNCSEWYHFSCVGLKVKPRKEWYCYKCSPMNS